MYNDILLKFFYLDTLMIWQETNLQWRNYNQSHGMMELIHKPNSTRVHTLKLVTSSKREWFDPFLKYFFLLFRLFATKCAGCLEAIPPTDLVMRALDNVYHLNCFQCIICGHQLEKGDQFVIRSGRLFCRPDFEKEMSLLQLQSSQTSKFFFSWCVCLVK